MHSDLIGQGSCKWLIEHSELPLNGKKKVFGPGSQYEMYGTNSALHTFLT